MPNVADYIESYGFKKFLRLSAREQNQCLYNRWPKANHGNLRQQKKVFIDSKLNVNESVNEPSSEPKLSIKPPQEMKESPKKETIQSDDEFEINAQFKEMINYHKYAIEQGVEKISMTDVLKYFQASKQLENQEKEFAEDNDFLQEVESQLMEFTFGEPLIENEVAKMELAKSLEIHEIED